MAHSSGAAFARPVLTKPIVCSAFHPVYQILIITARLPKLCFSTKIQNLSAFVNVCSVLAGFCTDTDCMQHLSNKNQRQSKTMFNSKIHSHPHLNEDISGPHKNTPTSKQLLDALNHTCLFQVIIGSCAQWWWNIAKRADQIPCSDYPLKAAAKLN